MYEALISNVSTNAELLRVTGTVTVGNGKQGSINFNSSPATYKRQHLISLLLLLY